MRTGLTVRWIIVVVVALDVVSTLWFRSVGLPEGNPLVRPFVDVVPLFVAVKMLVLVPAVLLLPRAPRLLPFAWIAVTVIGLAVAVNVASVLLFE